MDEDKLKFLLSLLEYPEESALTEYKSAVSFDSRSDFGAKLIKHILGQANTGGGYIIIGFQEDGSHQLQRDPNLTDTVSGSFETTRLSQSVDSFLMPGQRTELQVHKVPLDGRTYPVISTQGFKDSPYFCGKNYLSTKSKPILKEGAIYVRDLAAKTVVAAGPDHWNAILKRAVAQKQTEFVENMRTLLGQLGLTVDSSAMTAGRGGSSVSILSDTGGFASESEAARTTLKKMDTQAGFFEIRHAPVGISTQWSQSELLTAAERSVVRKTGWPIGIVTRRPESAPKPTVFGIRAIIDASNFGFIDYWAIEKKGAYFFLRLLDEDSDKDAARRGDQRWIYFDTRIWRVAEALLHCSNLYRELGVSPETQIAVSIMHSGLKGRLLGVADRMRMMHWNRKCDENESTWSKTLLLGSIEADLKELTKDVTRELFVLFEFWQPDELIFEQIYTAFLNSRV